jgi:hypothetical protein
MKHLQTVHLRLVHIFMLAAIGLMLWPAAAELTAYQNLAPSADVGQMVMVTVSLTYNGLNSTEAVVTPKLPYGVVANSGEHRVVLNPGVTQAISYPFTAQQSGSYWIGSDISWEEDGNWRSLSLEAPFTAVSTDAQTQGSTAAPGSNAGQNGSDNPQGSVPPATGSPGMPGDNPHADSPFNNTPPNGGYMPDGNLPPGMPHDGTTQTPGQGEEPYR